MRLMILLSICKPILGILILVLGIGCAGVQRPDAWICGVNARASKLRCYNIKHDYTSEGVLKSDATPDIRPVDGLMALNGGIYFSPKDFEKLKVWLADMRKYAQEHCQ